MLVPDPPPHVPPPPVTGQPLAGVDAVALPNGVAVEGDVTPRAAPPGEAARALGRIGLQSPSPLPSGSVLHVHVNERFELLDTSTISPLPFTQDILVHARPRPPDGGALGTSFPITPSRNYSIQELMRGVVTLDVAHRALDVYEVDQSGLDRLDRAVLDALCRRFGGGPVGVSTLAVAVGEERETVEEVAEPFLVRNGFLARTPRGRVATPLAWSHLGLSAPAAAPYAGDPALFETGS